MEFIYNFNKNYREGNMIAKDTGLKDLFDQLKSQGEEGYKSIMYQYPSWFFNAVMEDKKSEIVDLILLGDEIDQWIKKWVESKHMFYNGEKNSFLYKTVRQIKFPSEGKYAGDTPYPFIKLVILDKFELLYLSMPTNIKRCITEQFSFNLLNASNYKVLPSISFTYEGAEFSSRHIHNTSTNRIADIFYSPAESKFHRGASLDNNLIKEFQKSFIKVCKILTVADILYFINNELFHYLFLNNPIRRALKEVCYSFLSEQQAYKIIDSGKLSKEVVIREKGYYQADKEKFPELKNISKHQIFVSTLNPLFLVCKNPIATFAATCLKSTNELMIKILGHIAEIELTSDIVNKLDSRQIILANTSYLDYVKMCDNVNTESKTKSANSKNESGSLERS